MSEAMDFYLTGLEYVFENYKTQNGTRRYPARSCRELHLDFPEYPSGKFKLKGGGYLPTTGNLCMQPLDILWRMRKLRRQNDATLCSR